MKKCCCYFFCTPPKKKRAGKNRSVSNDRKRTLRGKNDPPKGKAQEAKEKVAEKIEGFAEKVRSVPAITKFRNAASKSFNSTLLSMI